LTYFCSFHISLVLFSPVSAEADIGRGGILNGHLMGSCTKILYQKLLKLDISSSSDNRYYSGCFFRTRCINASGTASGVMGYRQFRNCQFSDKPLQISDGEDYGCSKNLTLFLNFPKMEAFGPKCCFFRRKFSCRKFFSTIC